MKTKYWIAVIGGVLVLCLVLSALLLLPAEPATFVQVYSDGRLLHTLELTKDTRLTVESGYGTNVITVSGGKVVVTEATCPDGHCMRRGFCSSGAQIVCLPNRLVLRFTDTGGIDGVVG